jgi:hypothetical protein
MENGCKHSCADCKHSYIFCGSILSCEKVIIEKVVNKYNGVVEQKEEKGSLKMNKNGDCPHFEQISKLAQFWQ